MKNNTEILTVSEINSIKKAFDTVINCKYKDCKESTIRTAAFGMYLQKEDVKRKDPKYLFRELKEIGEEGNEPYVKNDSLTAWVNRASVEYGLEIRDILKMKKGDKIKLLMFDRNLGDYIHGKKKGSKYDPRKEGLSYGVYTHKKGLVGKLEFPQIGVVHDDFVWEVNLEAMRKPVGAKYKWFWGSIKGISDDCENRAKDLEKIDWKPKGGKLTIKGKKYDLHLKVGWRGPCIDKKDAKNLPKRVVHYDTWWNDYVPWKHPNFLKTKRKK